MACMQSKEQLKALKAQRAAAEAKAAEDAAKQAAKQVGFPSSLAFFLPFRLQAWSGTGVISILSKPQQQQCTIQVSTCYRMGVPHWGLQEDNPDVSMTPAFLSLQHAGKLLYLACNSAPDSSRSSAHTALPVMADQPAAEM